MRGVVARADRGGAACSSVTSPRGPEVLAAFGTGDFSADWGLAGSPAAFLARVVFALSAGAVTTLFVDVPVAAAVAFARVGSLRARRSAGSLRARRPAAGGVAPAAGSEEAFVAFAITMASLP
uniref:hypothetical protein n=1 Tax=Actinoplanes regularis TaxID=52697 RepID=UPI0015C60225